MNRHYLQPDWPAPNTIKAYVTTRQSDFSQTPYDDLEDVTENIRTLVTDLELPESPTWLRQVHGTRAVRIEAYKTSPEADASFTQQKQKICAILTADCLPILLCNRDGTEVAAVHAGWKGLLLNVIEATIHAMNSSPDDLLVWMGPALGPKKFKLGETMHADFININPDYQRAFHREQAAWHLDCYALAKQQLHQAGVNAIYGGGFCTFEEKERFFSFRRDNGVTGRMASLIYIT